MTTEATQIFDATISCDKKMQILMEIRGIETQIKNISEHCGSCKKWWTPDCHREWIDSRGQAHEPNFMATKCAEFEMSFSEQSSVKLAQAKIAELQCLFQSI